MRATTANTALKTQGNPPLAQRPGRRERRVLWRAWVLAGCIALLVGGARMNSGTAAAPAATPAPPAQAGPTLSRAQATVLVQKRYGARVVRTDIEQRGGREVFVFRLLSAGSKVWTVRIDAESGAEVP